MSQGKRPLQKGDRVAAYWTDSLGRPKREVATVVKREGDRVDLDWVNGQPDFAHIKQCRRLKPKRKAREFHMNWYRDDDGENGFAYLTAAEADNVRGLRPERIIVREVLPAKGTPNAQD